MNAIIETEALSKYYGKGNEIKALDNLNLKVYEGETFGLLGPKWRQGQGRPRSTINCIIKPTGGTATVNGYDLFS